MAMPKIGAKQNINRTVYTYSSNGLWKGSDGSTKTRAEMSSLLGTSTGVGATGPGASNPAAAPAAVAEGPLLQYPGDLVENGTGDYVSFSFFKYAPPYNGGTGGGATSAAPGQTYVNSYNGAFDDGKGLSFAGLSRIIMYMPEDLSTSYAQTWGGREFGPLAGMGLAAAGGIMNMNDPGAIAAAAGAFGNKMKNTIEGVAPYVASQLVAGAMNGIPGFGGSVSANDILASTRGEILNPNTEVLYQGQGLRNFNLNFKMLARSSAEADIIKSICNTFKKASLPTGRDKAQNLISVPNIVRVRFKHKNNDHPYLTQYKLCGIGNVQINYTPDGAYATYTTGAPVAITLGLQFQELKLIFGEDIDKGF
jgi:hypothetical protein